MIKLMPLVEQIQQDQLKEVGVKDIALGAAMAASSIFGGAKAQSKIPTDKPAITVSDTRTGTDVDGINGFFTSQFEFPTAFLKDLNSGKVTNLGLEGNNALQKVNESGITIKQMAEWNNYVKWMKSKGYSGDKQMDKKGFSENVLEQYKQENPGFWIKDNNDIKKIQTVLKGYRLYTIGIWKLGIKGALKAGFNPLDIEMGGVKMNPSKSEDVKRVESNYMPWAK
jgi:hypothetical protein